MLMWLLICLSQGFDFAVSNLEDCTNITSRESQESMQLILAHEIIKPRSIVPLREIFEIVHKRFFHVGFSQAKMS